MTQNFRPEILVMIGSEGIMLIRSKVQRECNEENPNNGLEMNKKNFLDHFDKSLKTQQIVCFREIIKLTYKK